MTSRGWKSFTALSDEDRAQVGDLYANSQNLGVFPVICFQAHGLVALHLEANGLEVLPEAIGGLKKLRALYLSSNRLTTLPAGIGGLESLRELFLGSNRLTTLPPEFEGLAALNTLNIYNNNFSKLPGLIGRLPSLEVLIAHKNPLVLVPYVIGPMPQCKAMTIDTNLPRLADKNPLWSSLLPYPAVVEGSGTGGRLQTAVARSGNTLRGKGGRGFPRTLSAPGAPSRRGRVVAGVQAQLRQKTTKTPLEGIEPPPFHTLLNARPLSYSGFPIATAPYGDKPPKESRAPKGPQRIAERLELMGPPPT